MKKIILVSFFQSNNMGDRLIGIRESELLEKDYEVVCVDFSALKRHADNSYVEIVQTNSVKSRIKRCITRFSIVSYIKVLLKTKKLFSEVLTEQNDADAVILAGGNMVMDTTFFPIYTAKVYSILKTAKRVGKKTALMFVGAGPVKNWFHKLYVKKSVGLCDYISVRDKNSKKLFNSICPEKEVIQAYDPVLSLKGQIYPSANAIGVSVFFGTDEKNYDKVKNSYKEIIKKIKKELPSYRIILFSSERSDYIYVDELYEELNDKDILIERIETSDELLNIYKKIDVLLGARMHSLITALVMRTPVIGFCWQEKVWGLSEIVDMKERFYPIDKLDNYIEQIVAQITEILNNLENETNNIDMKLKRISELINKSLKEFKERF